MGSSNENSVYVNSYKLYLMFVFVFFPLECVLFLSVVYDFSLLHVVILKK